MEINPFDFRNLNILVITCASHTYIFDHITVMCLLKNAQDCLLS